MCCKFSLKSFKKAILNLAVCCLAISLIMVTGCKDNNVLISFEVDTYLSHNTDFEKKAAVVLPSKEDIEGSKIIYYSLYDNSGASFEEGILCLTVEYSDEKFATESQRLEGLLVTENVGIGGSFYYNEVLYNSFQYEASKSDIGYCALAYNINLESNAISYIVFSCENLTYMDVESALNSFSSHIKETVLPH